MYIPEFACGAIFGVISEFVILIFIATKGKKK